MQSHRLRSVCAQLLVDGVPNANIVSDVFGVALPQQPGEPKEAYILRRYLMHIYHQRKIL